MTDDRTARWSKYGSGAVFPVDVVAIETIGTCNRACSYCPVSVSPKRLGRLPEPIVMQVFDELGELGFAGKLTYHFYNEPMLDRRIKSFIAYSARRVPAATRHLTTNGDALDRDGLTELFEAGASVVAISAHDAATYDRFQHIAADLPDGYKLQIRAYFRVGDGSRAARITNRAGSIDVSSFGSDVTVEASPEGCNRVELNIDYRGDVHPCCMDFSGGYVLGNIAETTLLRLWRENEHQFKQHFFGDYQREVCRKCAGLA